MTKNDTDLATMSCKLQSTQVIEHSLLKLYSYSLIFHMLQLHVLHTLVINTYTTQASFLAVIYRHYNLNHACIRLLYFIYNLVAISNV